MEQDEIDIIINFIEDEDKEDGNQSSAQELLYSIGDRAVEGKLTDASMKHDDYLYSRGEQQDLN